MEIGFKELAVDVLLDAAIDTAKMIPFLYIAFLLMEAFEHHAGGKLSAFLGKAGKSRICGPTAGAAVGCIPQCGFSVAASNLYSAQMITPGTLMAVFIATSDEAIPILLAQSEIAGIIWKLILFKLVIAVAAGFVFDLLFYVLRIRKNGAQFEEICSECGCGNHSIWYSSFKHTLSITLFILIVNLLLGTVIGIAGEETAFSFLNNMGAAQPLLTAIVGLIPNCAASVALTELYAAGGISFGSCVGGLCTGAGLGLAVLFKTNKNIKENMFFLGFLYVTGVICGFIINLF
ncbi:MAG: arsenic efflux protein [Huintestinicola sp.]